MEVSGVTVTRATMQAWGEEWARIERTIKRLDPDIPTSPYVALPGRQLPWFGKASVTDGGRSGQAVFGLQQDSRDTYSCPVEKALVIVDLDTRTAVTRADLFARIVAAAAKR